MSVYRVLDKLETYVHEGTWLPPVSAFFPKNA